MRVGNTDLRGRSEFDDGPSLAHSAKPTTTPHTHPRWPMNLYPPLDVHPSSGVPMPIIDVPTPMIPHKIQLPHSARSPSQMARPPPSSPLITFLCPPLYLSLSDDVPIPIIRHATPITFTTPFRYIPIANSATHQQEHDRRTRAHCSTCPCPSTTRHSSITTFIALSSHYHCQQCDCYSYPRRSTCAQLYHPLYFSHPCSYSPISTVI